ncbi:MAG: ATP-binding protein [Pseudomonadota bacterium]
MDVFSPQPPSKAMQCAAHGDYIAHALPLPYFKQAVWSGCPACAEARRLHAEHTQRIAEERARQARLEASLNRAGIPKRFRERNLENFAVEHAGQQRVLDFARQYVADFEAQRRRGATVVFSGRPGTGKSHLAIAIAQAVMQHGATAFYVTAREMMLMLRASWGGARAPSELEVLRMLTDVGLLVVDEIGVQFNTDTERTQFFSVIDGRYREQMPSLLLTNLDRDGLSAFLGERSFDRLREAGCWLAFDWEGWRARPHPPARKENP